MARVFEITQDGKPLAVNELESSFLWLEISLVFGINEVALCVKFLPFFTKVDIRAEN